MKNPPVDEDGKIRFIPMDVLALFLKFSAPEEIQTNGEFCFGSEVNEQIIEIIGVKEMQIANQLRDLQIMGINSIFTQKISIDGEIVRLHRGFYIQEKRRFVQILNLKAKSSITRKLKQ